MRLRDQVENPDRFRWQSQKQRDDFLKDIEERPLPEMPDQKLIIEMERVSNLVYVN